MVSSCSCHPWAHGIESTRENGAELGVWIVVGCGAGVPGCRVSGRGMCGLYSVILSISNWRADMLGRYMTPTYSSTLMHQELRLSFRRQRTCIDRIS